MSVANSGKCLSSVPMPMSAAAAICLEALSGGQLASQLLDSRELFRLVLFSAVRFSSALSIERAVAVVAAPHLLLWRG